MTRILFVCLGNICRSPAAEGVMQHLVDEAGLTGVVEIDSAGTGAWHVGEPADERMREAAARRGYELTSRARQVRGDELDAWDLVVAMDRSNADDLRALDRSGGAPIRLFSNFLPAGAPVDVPDPYYGGPDGFDRVLDLVEEGGRLILQRVADVT